MESLKPNFPPSCSTFNMRFSTIAAVAVAVVSGLPALGMPIVG